MPSSSRPPISPTMSSRRVPELAPAGNVPMPSMYPISLVSERVRRVLNYHEATEQAMERNRQEVAPFASGGGGTAAHIAGQTTRGHLWLLPPDSPLRRPWRANMVARPATTIGTGSTSPIRLSLPLTDAELTQLRNLCAILSTEALPEDRECAICCTEMSLPVGGKMMAESECVVRVPCGGAHCFHFRCIKPWLQKGRLCPTCRRTLKLSARKPPAHIASPLPPRPAAARHVSSSGPVSLRSAARGTR